MKMKPVKLMLMGITLLSAMFIASCSSDDGPVEGDKTALSAAITEIEDALSSAEEGTLEGQYQSGSKATLQAAVDAAKAVVADKGAEQAKVNSALANLQAALVAFEAKVVEPIDLANLVARWKFDEGTGTTANDESTNNFDGAFKTGPAGWGAGVPTWSTDRFGAANKALHFDKGANIEVPYNTALNPTKISISIWVKADEIKPGNRFIGLQSWIGYKFELQEANRPFLSIGKPDGGTYDRDSQQNLPINEWHHLIATFGGGNMVFYVDGELVLAWDNTPGDARSISGTPYNFVIGQDFPTDKYAATDTNFDNDHIIPLAWGGFFHGSLDDIRIYKSVLTASQVASIYASEKP
ncbi:hypothetical protein D4L85_14275 [Chryseolinea soli]|uniref:LamG-like jellyroll fold domain-containing protein n=2 Tax=Chryseolinea soli TaxID=2321403 RepID=A0A385SS75_9BACT|nr:hypothetical protein D4L85_14275 [Chryseolinea soli]